MKRRLIYVKSFQRPNDKHIMPAEIQTGTQEGKDEKTMARILVAEDAIEQLVVLRMYLRSGGHESRSGNNGLEALQILDDDPDFDLIVTDLMMPVMGGRELILSIRARESLRDIPILVVSALSRRDVQDLVDNQDCRFLSKPVFRQQLLDAVDSMVPTEFA